MRSCTSNLFACFLMILLISVQPGSASTRKPFEFADALDSADLVVRGRIVEMPPESQPRNGAEKRDSRGQPFHYGWLEIDEFIYGTLSTKRVPIALHPDPHVQVAGEVSLRYEVGDEGVFCLTPEPANRFAQRVVPELHPLPWSLWRASAGGGVPACNYIADDPATCWAKNKSFYDRNRLAQVTPLDAKQSAEREREMLRIVQQRLEDNEAMLKHTLEKIRAQLKEVTEKRAKLTAAPDLDAPWSEAVAGLRMRLATDRASVLERQGFGLTVELENVGDRTITLTSPQLLPIISAPGNQPFQNPELADLVITAKTLSKDRIIICWAGRQFSVMSRELNRLKPGDRFVLDITTNPAQVLMEKRREAKPFDRPQVIRDKAQAGFAYASHPGRYRLQATYEIKGGRGEKKTWTGKLVSPPVEIEVTRPPPPEQKPAPPAP